MQSFRAGGIAAVICALTYVFGFVLFIGVIAPPEAQSDISRLHSLIAQRDVFYIGYLVIGIVFSLSLIALNQSLQTRFVKSSPVLSNYNAVLGNIWVTFVLASTFVFLVNLSLLAKYANTDENNAVITMNTIHIVVDALGGGIELIGALWVFVISYMGLKQNIYPKATHILGLIVGFAGVLTLFSGLSMLADNVFFEATTTIFGLGQILWFILLGTHLLKDNQIMRK
ncbi:hypothetical protein KUL42_19180 [Alteromonas sp. KUL42]|uniref:DUF4386 family protein n=1 Tax=Alteromonas sp. KUL42 TaxID=2480797 RepID=UPI0010358AB1|nr:DUF4386 family protein [Alteromonas sp. KUL42]TAP35666.1 DUF4386 family protein [Alteromonas sp. KUL42]GEA07157.1 hypothetical protein KUL42_19180 [Alteromonas sp. KUL42]